MPVRIDALADYIALNTSGAPTFTSYSITYWEQVVNDNAGTNRMSYLLQDGAPTYHLVHKIARALDNVDRLSRPGVDADLSSNLSNSTWVMWALSCAGTGGSDLKCYAWNAADADGSYKDATLQGVGTSTISAWCLGSNNGYSEWRDARYAFIKVWDAALSLAEFQAERVQGKPVRTSNVNRYHRLETNTDTADYSGNGRTAGFNGALTTEGTEPVPWELTASGAPQSYYRRLLVR